MNFDEARRAWQADSARLSAMGVVMPGVRSYIPDGWKANVQLALDAMSFDAQPSLATDPNSAVPAMLTTMIDPSVFRILFAPTKAAEIFGEASKGSWLDDVAMFPVVEHTGEVTSYGDYATSGNAGANTNWPQRQSYLFQTVKQYGERELERAGLAKISWVTEIDEAAATVMNRYQNLTYFFGVSGLQNYGLLNDPNLPAALTPATKAVGGGTKWIVAGVVVASANEIYSDIESTFIQLVSQSAGLVDRETSMTLALSPSSEAALTQTNSFNVNVSDLLKKNFPNMKVVSAIQYGAQSASNPQGVVGGNLMQLFADKLDGQDTGYCAFNVKMRSHPIVRELSSFKQKATGGSWGAIIRMPVAIAQMLGI